MSSSYSCLRPSTSQIDASRSLVDAQLLVDAQPLVDIQPLEVSVLLQERQEAYRYARRFGLSMEESEDCAADFVLHCLTRSLSFKDAPAQRRACAHNFACDVFRAKSRYARVQALSAAHFLEASDYPVLWSSPETALFQLTFWNLVRPAFSSLPQALQTMLLDHYGTGWTAKELAGRQKNSRSRLAGRKELSTRRCSGHGDASTFF